MASINDRERYYGLHPGMRVLWEYVLSHDFSGVPPSRIAVDGDKVVLNLDEAELQPLEQRRMEVHRRYIDVVIPLTMSERIGWMPLADIAVDSMEPFDEARDIAFYDVRPQTLIAVHPGEFCVFFPSEAHAPLIGEGHTRKIVGKLLL